MPSRERHFPCPPPSEITPRRLVEGRRQWLQRVGAGALGAGLAAWAARDALAQARLAALPGAKGALPGAVTMEKPTSKQDATSYNNYYEFGTDKADPAQHAHTLKTRPWTVAVEGEVRKPKTFDIDELLKLAPMEERVYRL